MNEIEPTGTKDRELTPPKIYKCEINHAGDRINISLWTAERESATNDEGKAQFSSILIIPDIGESLISYENGITRLTEAGYKVFGFDLEELISHTPSDKHGFFKKLCLEVIQVIAFIKKLDDGAPPIILSQGLGSLVGLVNARKHPTFVGGFVACSPMFQLVEKIKPLRRFVLKTLAEFTPSVIVPAGICPRFTRNRKVEKDDLIFKVSPKITARQTYDYLKGMSQARRNFSKLSVPTLLICPDNNIIHRYTFLKNAVPKHKNEKDISLVNLHTKYHAVASDRSDHLDTYDTYIIPWLDQLKSKTKPSQSSSPKTEGAKTQSVGKGEGESAVESSQSRKDSTPGGASPTLPGPSDTLDSSSETSTEIHNS